MSEKLKILFTNNAPLIKHGIAQGFKNLGYDIFIMDKNYQLWDKSKERQVEIFKRAVEEFHPSIVFSECFANFAEGIFEHTKEKGIFHVFFSIEDTPYDHWIGDYWSDYADHIFTTTAECLPNYWNKGRQAELMLFGCNPSFHKSVKTDITKDIVLVANNYERRFQQTKDYIIPLVEQNYNIEIYGNEWWTDSSKEVNLCNSNAYKGYMAYENLPLLYSSSKIALGQNLDGNSVTQSSMRMAEVMGIGGALLVSPYTKSQEFLFNDHIYLPKTGQEMIDMVDEILSMTDKQRQLKAKKAQKYVYKYHNYDIRAKQVIDAYYGLK
ncbi:Spore maturation protein CgeB [Paenibacillus sophorae]|uniref:Glycosyltransferase n=1 Tax=Paenibacillus sophorae TaxID=1333845 RepID=A0A1H8H4F2_9BACL|nr:glycosyltransferase [Paenibacillus sophorae]QWU14441.1 glycosyltransferase [Paenibacillus sophorae]SEN51133.1 Spore maturation protein CgeB [Paenibacillus sophorae]